MHIPRQYARQRHQHPDGSHITLDDVAEHLHIEATGTIALGDSSIDVAAVIETIGQTELGKQLRESGFLVAIIEGDDIGIGCSTHDIEIQRRLTAGDIVNLRLGDVVAQAEGSRQMVGDVDVRFQSAVPSCC